MSRNVGGTIYEKKIINSIQKTRIAGNIDNPAGSSNTEPDADFIVAGIRHLLEVKQNSKTQMGGTSLAYDGVNFSTSKAEMFDTRLLRNVIAAAKRKQPAIDKFLRYIGADGVPFTCSKETWKEARDQGLLKEVNTKVQTDAEFICRHYREKGVNYIQIGGSGLFHLGENPANLPIPKLQGKVDIEMRLGAGGSKNNNIGAGFRVQARLKDSVQSKYSFENPEEINKILEIINE